MRVPLRRMGRISPLSDNIQTRTIQGRAWNWLQSGFSRKAKEAYVDIAGSFSSGDNCSLDRAQATKMRNAVAVNQVSIALNGRIDIKRSITQMTTS